jgi:hypothetical protein
MAHAFFLGVDLADGDDPFQDATITILEKETEEAEAPPRFRLGHVRDRPDVSPDALAEDLQELVAEQPYIGRTNMIVNQSAPGGQALVEALTDRGLDPIAAVLTDGRGAVPGDPDGAAVHLGTVDAVRTLATLYRDGRLTVEDYTTEAASRLARGIQHAAEVLDAADGNQDTPAAAGNSLDALDAPDAHVVSASLAAWCGTERSFDPSQHLKEAPQTTPPGNDSVGR